MMGIPWLYCYMPLDGRGVPHHFFLLLFPSSLSYQDTNIPFPLRCERDTRIPIYIIHPILLPRLIHLKSRLRLNFTLHLEQFHYDPIQPRFSSAPMHPPLSGSLCRFYILISKLVPQPQLLLAAGLSTILNWLPINSMV